MEKDTHDLLRKWRLILGKQADPEQSVALGESELGMDGVLDALYDSDRDRGLGSSSPHVNRWLGDIRTYFPAPAVQLLQKDALERLGLEEMLLEPELLETIEPDVDLVSTLLSLQSVMPSRTRETAREVVRALVEKLEKQLRNPLQEAIKGSLSRAVRNRRPRLQEIDWHATIRANLKHYQQDYKTVIPERLIGHGRRSQKLKHVVLLVDQSGSMASSVVYSSIIGSIMASLRSLRTHMVVFDTSVVDLTEKLDDPVDLLFAAQLGGGTHINRALQYAQQLITNPLDTIVVLISDLMEGGPEEQMLRTVQQLQQSGLQFYSLLALNDKGAPAFDHKIAGKMAGMGIPSFACTPDQFPDLMASAIRKEAVHNWLGRKGIVAKY